MSTFGLLSKGKGIEYAIQALPEVIKREHRIVYYVLGVTHPQVKKADGEAYRNMLMRMVKNLGSGLREISEPFSFKAGVAEYLLATDVYITPYLSPNQVSSGTLSYALGAGKAVVSTPYLHAKEALGEGRGVFCRFNDSASIAERVTEIIENKPLRESLEHKAYKYSRKFTSLYHQKILALFDELIRQSKEEWPSTFPHKA